LRGWRRSDPDVTVLNVLRVFPHALIYPLSYYCAFQPSSAPAGPPLGGPSFRSDKRPCASDVPSKRSSALVQQNAADCTCSCFYSRALSAALLFTPKVYVVDQTTDSWSVFHLASWKQHLASEFLLTVTSTTSLHFNISSAIKHSQRDSPRLVYDLFRSTTLVIGHDSDPFLPPRDSVSQLQLTIDCRHASNFKDFPSSTGKSSFTLR
jgi:hypothetical protein